MVLRVGDLLDGGRIISLFSETNGHCKGCVHPDRKSRYLFARGARLKVEWYSRLNGALGTLSCELLEAFHSQLLGCREKLLIFDVLLITLGKVLPENQSYPKVYHGVLSFLSTLKHAEDWYQRYIELMLLLMLELGLPLQLSTCAIHGVGCEDVEFISPRTGLGVCAEAGSPYVDRLFAINSMLRNAYRRSSAGYELPKPLFKEALQVVKYFLYHRYLGVKEPESLWLIYSSL